MAQHAGDLLPESNGQALRVVVIGKEALGREFLARALVAANLDVTGAFGTVEACLAHAASFPPEVAIVDVPELEARTVVASLRSAGCRFPILVLTEGTQLQGLMPDGAGLAFLDKRTADWSKLVSALGLLSGLGDRVLERGRPHFSARLSPREREVLGFISVGMDNLKIAAHLGLSERSVKAHVTGLYRKLNVENRTQLAIIGMQMGLGVVTVGLKLALFMGLAANVIGFALGSSLPC